MTDPSSIAALAGAVVAAMWLVKDRVGVQETINQNTERIAALEAKYAAEHERVGRIEERLDSL